MRRVRLGLLVLAPVALAGTLQLAGASPATITQLNRIRGPEPDLEFGRGLAAAGDVNGDGFADVIVGAHDRAYLYLGSSNGLINPAAWTLVGDTAGALGWRSVAGAGDVNGDGYDDIIIGDNLDDTAGENAGRAMVYLGSASGPATSPVWEHFGQFGHAAGYGVASAGDVNADGFDDILVYALGYTNEESGVKEGLVLLFHGSASGPSPMPNWSGEGNSDLGFFGLGMDAAGDLDADGFDDVVIGDIGFDGADFGSGKVYVFFGSAAGLEPVAAWSFEGGANDSPYGAALGDAVAGGGDIDGDGYGDLLIGDDQFTSDPSAQLGEGQVTLTRGGLGGLAPIFDWQVESNTRNGALGHSIDGCGDVDGDGFDDFIVGMASISGSGRPPITGSLRLHLGPSSPPTSGFAWQWSGIPDSLFTHKIAGVGDINGDGRSDFAATAPLETENGTEYGAVYVFSGCVEGDSDGRCDFVDNCLNLANPDQLDGDADGAGDPCDCASGQADVWAPPGPTRDLVVLPGVAPGASSLQWSAPSATGGTVPMAYEVLRSPDPSDFDSPAVCLTAASGGAGTSLDDLETPPVGSLFAYLPRARNTCGTGASSLGASSTGVPRVGRSCP